MSAVNWELVGVPQENGYDTGVILAHMVEGRYGKKPVECADGVRVWSPGNACWVTKLARDKHPSAEYTILPTDDEIVQAGLDILELWPTVRDQSARILRALCPMTSAPRANQRGGGHGCSCGQFGDDFGWIYVTADDPWGFAEGIVHEMGHWKLRALGIWFEDWTPLILENKPAERYASPVRKDMKRPMGAVLHGQYSYIHVARMTALALQAKEKPELQDIEWAELQLSRITEGQATVREYARGTPDVGEPFLAGVDKWTTEVLEEGKRIAVAARARC